MLFFTEQIFHAVFFFVWLKHCLHSSIQIQAQRDASISLMVFHCLRFFPHDSPQHSHHPIAWQLPRIDLMHGISVDTVNNRVYSSVTEMQLKIQWNIKGTRRQLIFNQWFNEAFSLSRPSSPSVHLISASFHMPPLIKHKLTAERWCWNVVSMISCCCYWGSCLGRCCSASSSDDNSPLMSHIFSSCFNPLFWSYVHTLAI